MAGSFASAAVCVLIIIMMHNRAPLVLDVIGLNLSFGTRHLPAVEKLSAEYGARDWEVLGGGVDGRGGEGEEVNDDE